MPDEPLSDAGIAAAYSERADEYVRLLGEIEQMDAADRALIASWRDSTSGTLLDAGSGPGMWTRFLSGGIGGEVGASVGESIDRGAGAGATVREAWGLDITEAFVASARVRFPDTRFEVGSFREIPAADASLGGILAWYSLIHTRPEDVPAALGEFARVLAPGGSLLLGYFDGDAGEPFAHRIATAYFWSADALGELLVEAGFVMVATERRERRPGEPSSRTHGAITAIRTGAAGAVRAAASAAASAADTAPATGTLA